MTMESAWTEARIAALGELWRQGLSTAEIGRRLGISKNAVVGKAHRLELSARPSPIKLRPIPAPMPRPAASPAPQAQMPAPGRLPALTLAPRAAAPVRLVQTGGKASACQWPHGHPGQPGFHFCGEPAAPGKPYCTAHAARAYVSGKSRSDAA